MRAFVTQQSGLFGVVIPGQPMKWYRTQDAADKVAGRHNDGSTARPERTSDIYAIANSNRSK